MSVKYIGMPDYEQNNMITHFRHYIIKVGVYLNIVLFLTKKKEILYKI